MEESLAEYEENLRENERSVHTIEKYLRDVRSFLDWKGEQELTKSLMVRWKQALVDAGYQVRSINSMLASVNSYLRFIGKEGCRTGNLKLQRQLYSKPQQELSRNDYMKLLALFFSLKMASHFNGHFSFPPSSNNCLLFIYF